MERDERLKAAKEKLKKFQKKRQSVPTTNSSTPDAVEAEQKIRESADSTPQSELSTASKNMMASDVSSQLAAQAHQQQQLNGQERQSVSPQLFTFPTAVHPDQDPVEFIVGGETLPSSQPEPQPQDNSNHNNNAALAISDQISQVLSASNNAELFDESNETNEMAVLKGRLAQLERENHGLNSTIQQQTAALQQWEAHSKQITQQLNGLQAENIRQTSEYEAKLKKETSELTDKLNAHAASINILVAEKAGLERDLDKTKRDLVHAQEENKLLKTSRPEQTRPQVTMPAAHRCGCTDRVFLAEVERKRLSDDLSNLRDERDRLKIESIDYKQELMELKSKMETKDTEMIIISKELMETAAKLEIAEVNLAQLRSASKGPEDNIDADDDSEGKEGNEEKETNKQKQESTKKEAEADTGGKLTPGVENTLKEKDSEIFRLTLENDEHAKRVSELSAYIQQASQDREQIIHQYTSYSQQLAAQIETLTQQLEVKVSENKDFSGREADLVAHVQRLEAQLQKLIQGQGQDANVSASAAVISSEQSQNNGNSSLVSAKEVELMQEKTKDLDAKLSNVLIEREKLHCQLQEQSDKVAELSTKLSERETAISDLETKLDIVSEKNTLMDLSQHESLVAASSSDKVAASRAMKQNKQLKEQVEELEHAVMQVTNSKASLMNEYDAVKAKFAKIEESEASRTIQIQGLEAAVKEKDRNLNRMRDQMKYYVAFAENSIHGRLDSGLLKDSDGEDNENAEAINNGGREAETQFKKMVEELQNANDQIRSLNSQNSELKSQIEVLSSQTRDNSSAGFTPERDVGDEAAIGEDQAFSSSSESSSGGQNQRPPSGQSTASSVSDSSSLVADVVSLNNNNTSATVAASIPPLSKDVALLKLEQKFKNAMGRIAELAAEKEQLEHLIVRLQEETDTVGEYITIYQYQRSQQRLRLEEKEKQLQAVSRDREDLKVKLAQLQSLVTAYVSKNNPESALANGASPDEVAQEATELIDTATTTNKNIDHDEEDGSKTLAMAKSADDTAGKILSLITEIGSNEALTKPPTLDDFHPWFFYESSPGKMMTV